MSTRHKLVILATVVAAVSVYYFSTFEDSRSQSAPQSDAGISQPTQSVTKPKLFRFTGYPPQTADEKAMWDWWNHMNKVDSDFEWKTSIEFFGQVVDQNHQPVPNATVTCNWSTLPGKPNKTLLSSDSIGRFELSGVSGKRLSVRVAKDGYISGKDGVGSFEYAAFFEPFFHVPNSSRPVVFRIWKIGAAEPMYLWNSAFDVAANGKPQWINVGEGKLGGRDLAVSVTRSNQTAPLAFDYKVIIESPGGIMETKDEPMFNAPTGGYLPSLTVTQNHGAPDYSTAQDLRFYIKTTEGKYAAVKAEIINGAVASAQVQLTIYFNPSGSNNLEYDSRRRINK